MYIFADSFTIHLMVCFISLSKRTYVSIFQLWLRILPQMATNGIVALCPEFAATETALKYTYLYQIWAYGLASLRGGWMLARLTLVFGGGWNFKKKGNSRKNAMNFYFFNSWDKIFEITQKCTNFWNYTKMHNNVYIT